ncbi:hypothetical protein CPT03_03025 [Pedobacter ginsengisoli]|uniref:DUF3298 domain-containing protein n=1 Tax=Pedobacter ginsengisoli TaxID=363852 RepID=A0A2D1U1M3_9SPHI|nr:DUF3298 and DUF4163 domain-containing protein [Pedobacter ginsengisoli]ATP55506.1 hypothetical protein CPT03_03025 [Pedobacter ginsengisoli]
MKKLGLFVIAIGFMACQSENKSSNTADTANLATSTDSLTFKYDSVKVYSKTPVSINKTVTDTSKAVISYPLFNDEKINQFIESKIKLTADSGKNYKTYNDYASDFIKGYDDFKKSEKDYPQTWFLDIKAKVVTQKPGYLSLLNTYVNYAGGAHPNSIFTYINYNPVTHQEILLDSLIQPGSMIKLTAIAEKIFRKNEKLSATASLKDGYFFEKDTFKLNDNFTITDQGLMFLYNPYEIKAYVYGTTELVIPFSELKEIAKPNSLLSHTN